jgi:hypothetical protein
MLPRAEVRGRGVRRWDVAPEDTVKLGVGGVVEDDASDSGAGRGDLTPQLLNTDLWSEALLADAGIPVVDSPVVSVGGGMGSFVFADYLRVAGVPTSSIRVLSVLDQPWQTYQYLTRVSQVPAGERLRSDASSCPGCLWGFPSYGMREAWKEKTLAPLFSAVTEPIFTDYWTPKAGRVFADIQREADRISWWDCAVKGQVRMVRKRAGGGYFSLHTPPAGTTPTKRVAYRSTYVHLAVGYPGLKFLPDLQEYRQRHPDSGQVVNAYEPHEQVYQQLRSRPGVVMIRGSGIVASRLLQRLIDDRDHAGAQTQIIHLFRTYVDSAQGPSIFLRRRGGNGWAYQGFNWPKSAWGGQAKERFLKLEGDERKAYYDILGGTNTPHRKLWLRQLARGRREGFYRTYVGQVMEVKSGDHGQVVTEIRTKDGATLELSADFVIDATGLEADIREHRLLADLLDHGGAGRNPLGRLDVERTFEVRGTRSEPGRLYAVGSATLGGYFAGVDTFLGLQYAAQQVTDDLARQSFCPRIGVGRSISQWWKWALNTKI